MRHPPRPSAIEFGPGLEYKRRSKADRIAPNSGHSQRAGIHCCLFRSVYTSKVPTHRHGSSFFTENKAESVSRQIDSAVTLPSQCRLSGQHVRPELPLGTMPNDGRAATTSGQSGVKLP